MNFKHYLSINSLIIILILVVAAYLRFVGYPLKYGFDFDPTRDALIVSYGASGFQFPLLGPKSGIALFSFGPWYYYELILFKILVPVMYSPWILIGIMSTLVVAIMYRIGKELEGEKFGLLLASITALSPEEIGPTTGLSNPNFVPFHAALTILFFVVYFRRSLRWWWIIIWGFVLGIGINHHYQMVLLTPLPVAAIVYRALARFPGINFRKLIADHLLYFTGVLASFIPLIVYELSHDFRETKGFIYFLQVSRHTVYIPNNWTIYLHDFWLKSLSMIFGIPQLPTLILFVLVVFVLFLAFWNKRLSPVYIVLFAIFALDVVFLRYFVVQRELYYVLFIHPLLFIFSGLAFWQLINQNALRFLKYLALLILILMMPSALYQGSLRVAPFSDQRQVNSEAEILQKNFPSQTFNLYGCSEGNLNITQGIAFVLNQKHLLDQDGNKIAFISDSCTAEVLESNNVDFKKIPFTDNVLIKSNKFPDSLPWKLVTPEMTFKTLYD